MTAAVSVSRPRVPVVAGGHRVPGLWERGQRRWLDHLHRSRSGSPAKVKRITLPKGITKAEAVKEARELTVGIDTET